MATALWAIPIFVALIVSLGWLVVYVIWQELFTCERLPENTPEARERLRAEAKKKERQLIKDLKGHKKTGSGIRKVRSNEDGSLDIGKHESLSNLGISENTTASEEDIDNAEEGDHWLCDNRPVWFGVIQFFFATLTACLIFYLSTYAIQQEDIALAFSVSFLSTVLVTIFIGTQTFVIVPENMRLGVKRFGRQLDGFLGPGLHFVLFESLGWFETIQEVSLQNRVWGPHGEKTGVNYINGTLGAEEGNPEPGVIHINLRTTWGFTVYLAITMRVLRSRKSAWYLFLNEFESEIEIGQQIATVAMAILSTKAREIQANMPAKEEDQAEYLSTMFIEFVSTLPEVTAAILLALQGLGKFRIGGIFPVSVAIPNIIPDKPFKDMLQNLDRSRLEVLRRKLEGEATSNRLKEALQALDKDERTAEAALQMLGYFTTERFAETTDGQGRLDQLVSAFLAGKAREVTQTPPQSQGTTQT